MGAGHSPSGGYTDQNVCNLFIRKYIWIRKLKYKMMILKQQDYQLITPNTYTLLIQKLTVGHDNIFKRPCLSGTGLIFINIGCRCGSGSKIIKPLP